MTDVEPFDDSPRVRARPACVTRAAVAAIGPYLDEALGGTLAADADIGTLEDIEEDSLHSVGYLRSDAENAFDDLGVLRARLPLYCSPSGAGDVLIAFAYFGLAVTIPHADDEEDLGEDAFIPVDAATRETDLILVLRAFDALRARGVEAEPNLGLSRTDGFGELRGNGASGAVFWHAQAHWSFDSSGNLTDDLYLHWEGNRETIGESLVDALRGTHLGVQVPEDETSTFVIKRRSHALAETKAAGASTASAEETPLHLVCSSGTSNKFWEIVRDDATLVTKFGKVGTKGQLKTKAFDSVASASAARSKLVSEKLGKGYVER